MNPVLIKALLGGGCVPLRAPGRTSSVGEPVRGERRTGFRDPWLRVPRRHWDEKQARTDSSLWPALLALTALGVGMAGADPLRRRRRRPNPPPRRPRPPFPRCRPGLRQRSRRRRRRPRRPRRPRLHRPDRHQRGARPRRPPAGEPARRTGARSAAPPASTSRRGDRSGGSLNGRRRQERRRHPQPGPRRRRRRRSAPAAASPPRSATGGGVQPQADGADGGSQFGDGGSPTTANPTTTIAPFGPAPIGVPNFVIDSFEIPPFLLPIYQACGTEYGIPWEVLASINKIETGVRHQPQRLQRRRGRLDAVPALELGNVRASTPTATGARTPTTRSTRSAPPPTTSRSPAAARTSTTRSSPTTTPTGTSQEVLLYARAYGKLPDRPGRLADRPDRGRPLPGRRRRPLRRRHLGPRGAEARDAGRARRLRQRRRSDLLLADPARDQHLRRRRARRSSPSTTA